MKKFGVNCQLQNKLVIFHFSLVKATMNAPQFVSLTSIGHGAIVLLKRRHLLIFQLPKAEQRPLRTCQL
jgi:hypothetical protein